MSKSLTLSNSELATVLAALRFYQGAGQGDPMNRTREIQQIASNDGDLISLDSADIDDLCERLNV